MQYKTVKKFIHFQDNFLIGLAPGQQDQIQVVHFPTLRYKFFVSFVDLAFYNFQLQRLEMVIIFSENQTFEDEFCYSGKGRCYK